MTATVVATEAQFQAAVIECAHWAGWLVHHTRPSRTASGGWATAVQGNVGFPDLVLSHPTRGTVFVELKTVVGRVTKYQQDWLDTLRQSGAEAHLWRPTDWPAIRERLTGRT